MPWKIPLATRNGDAIFAKECFAVDSLWGVGRL
jgi:hypothetical protein